MRQFLVVGYEMGYIDIAIILLDEHVLANLISKRLV